MYLEPKRIALSDLLLDPNNYRFHDLQGWKRVNENRFHEQRVQQTAAQHLQNTTVFELSALKDSIRTNGFVPVEQIVVKPYAPDGTKYLVIEGNRRVAAIKWLLDDDKSGVLNLSPQEKRGLRELDALILDVTRADNKQAVEVLMAIRHVSGVKEWGAYQQARLIVELMAESGATFANVAERLGMSSREVARRYRASKALEQMESDEEYGDYAEKRMYAIFHEAVAQPTVRDWLGWQEEQCCFDDRSNLDTFYSLICPTDGKPAKITSYEDVRTKLRHIIQHPRAVQAVQDPDKSLAQAHQIAVEEDGIAYDGSRLETAINGALKALDDLPYAKLRVLTGDQVDLLRALTDKIQLMLRDYERLRGE